MTKVEIVKAKTFELDLAKKYSLIFDKRTISQEDVIRLTESLTKQGINGISVILKGDIDTVKMVEVNES